MDLNQIENIDIINYRGADSQAPCQWPGGDLWNDELRMADGEGNGERRIARSEIRKVTTPSLVQVNSRPPRGVGYRQ